MKAMGMEFSLKKIFVGRSDATMRFLLAISCVITFLTTWFYIGPRHLPLWSDAGEWLKYTNALEAEVALRLGLASLEEVGWKLQPMWGQGAFQYPPLFFILLSFVKPLTGPVLGLKILGALLLSLQSIPSFLLARRIAKNDYAGLLAAYASSIPPLYVEMYGWGGYPNLLGFLLLGFSFYFILCGSERPSKKNLLKVFILSSLIALSHHLTLFIYLGTLALWSIFRLAFGNRCLSWLGLIVALGSSGATMLLYFFLLLWPPQYQIYNEAAYYALRFNLLETIPWIFKEPTTIISIAAIVLVMFLGIRLNPINDWILLLAAWAAFPCLATLGFLFGVAIDYNRVFFFAIQPILVLVGIPAILLELRPYGAALVGRRSSKDSSLGPISSSATISCPEDSGLSHASGSIESNLKLGLELRPLFHFLSRKLKPIFPSRLRNRRILAYALITLSIIASLRSFTLGIETMGKVNEWYGAMDPYGDREKLAALEWIRRNTDSDDIFVAEEIMARWIEGYCSRRVFLYTEPRFLFIEGQMDRYYIASSILLSNYEIRNGYLRIFDQGPYNPCTSPSIFFWSNGEYKASLIFDDSLTIVRASMDNKTLEITSFSRFNITKSFLLISGDEAKILTLYVTPYVRLLKVVRVLGNLPRVLLGYEVVPVNSSTVLHNVTIASKLYFERSISLIEAGDGWASVDWDLGRLSLKANALFTADTKTSQRRGLYATFQALPDGRVVGEVEVSINNTDLGIRSGKLEAYSRSELLKLYNITYIVLPRIDSEDIRSFPDYQHLIMDERLKIVYLNDRLIILRSDPLGRNKDPKILGPEA